MNALALALTLAAPALAVPADDPPYCEVDPSGGVYLITMSPGDAPFSFVGHTAVWIHHPMSNTDRVYSFGTIDSTRQEPLSALLSGTLECGWGVRSRGASIDRYRSQDRSMIAQRIELPPGMLRQMMVEIQRRARSRQGYLFHWFERSCATEIRDILDLVMDGALAEQLQEPAPLSPRGEVLRHLGPQALAWLGWHHQAGAWADREITMWEASFAPDRLSDAVAAATWTDPDGETRPLVSPPCSLYQGEHAWPEPEPPRRDGLLWGIGLAVGAGFAGLGAGAAKGSRWLRRGLGLGTAGLGLFAGVLGTANALLWGFSALEGFGPNENWFVTSPLSFLLVPAGLAWALGRGGWRRSTAALAGLALLGLVLQPLPFFGQQNLGVIGLFLPALVALAWVARRLSGPQP